MLTGHFIQTNRLALHEACATALIVQEITATALLCSLGLQGATQVPAANTVAGTIGWTVPHTSPPLCHFDWRYATNIATEATRTIRSTPSLGSMAMLNNGC